MQRLHMGPLGGDETSVQRAELLQGEKAEVSEAMPGISVFALYKGDGGHGT
jgi:hypothetical protein